MSADAYIEDYNQLFNDIPLRRYPERWRQFKRQMLESLWYLDIKMKQEYKSPKFEGDTDSDIFLYRVLKQEVSYDHNTKTVSFTVDGNLNREDDEPALIFDNGRKEFYRNGLLHRVSGPAVETEDGDHEYFFMGKRHRVFSKEPAIVRANGRGWVFYEQGKKHRNGDFPAERNEAGDLLFYKNGLLSRDENRGPAVINVSGTIEYYRAGKRHRSDGPAVQNLVSGFYEYWHDGVLDRPESEGPATYDPKSGMTYRRLGKLHRDADEPAVIKFGVGVMYYKNNQLSRDERFGPAVILDDGTEMYYLDGVKHRTDGKPAVCYPDGRTEYWQCGTQYEIGATIIV